MLEQLHFYYTNDFHSNFQQWPRTAGYIKREKAFQQRRGHDCWIVDIGDHMDRAALISEAFLGKANVELMNDAGYDVATLGNNEGITLSHDELFHLYDEAAFTVVCSNLKVVEGENPSWLLPETTLLSSLGTRIGMIGLTAAFKPFYEPLGWHVDDPYDILSKQVRAFRKTHDIVILLSHLGLSDDEEIARRFPEIDVIIGGHTHHLLKNGKMENGVLLTAAGKGSWYVGEVIIDWETEDKQLLQKQAFAHHVAEARPEQDIADKLAQLERQAEQKMAAPVADLQEPLPVDWFRPTAVIRSLADKLRSWTGADCAMINAGVLLEYFPAGPLTAGDVHRICPHPINPCTVAVNGNELLEIIRAGRSKELIEFPLKGFGFRGEVIGCMVFSGLELVTEKRESGQDFIRTATIGGNRLEPDRIYKLATADMFTFGRLFPEIARAADKKYFLPEFLRDLLKETIKEDPHIKKR